MKKLLKLHIYIENKEVINYIESKIKCSLRKKFKQEKREKNMDLLLHICTRYAWEGTTISYLLS